MKKYSKKTISIIMCLVMLTSLFTVGASAAAVEYTIINPYESVEDLLPDADNHYKTNLHTHSTYSDATENLANMVYEHYNQDFDVLAFSDHGVIGRRWDQAPTIIPLYQYNPIIGNEQKHLTTEEFNAILAGTYQTPENERTKGRGMQCVTNAIEANMLVLNKNHVNGYFTEVTEGYLGEENNFEEVIKRIHLDGGLSHINHPGDWLGSGGDPDMARDPKNVAIFTEMMEKYDSCLGIEVFNAFDRPTSNDRILWDEMLQVIIPQGERNVWGFANNDAHATDEIDTCFMDFILPEYSDATLRTAMEDGTFFAVSRYAHNEMGDDFVGTGAYPQFTEITVDDDQDTITITGINCSAVEWIANGEIIETVTTEADGTITSIIKLREHSDDISCYVRAQLKGEGGITLTQPFVCDDGNMQPETEDEITRPNPLDQFSDIKDLFDLIEYIFKNNMIYALLKDLF